MKFAMLAAISGLAMLTAGCVIVDADVEDDWEGRYSSSAERVYSADITEDSITIRVAASGCTTKDFFDVDVDREGDDRFEVEFERDRRDYCRMLQPEGEALSWSFSELGSPDGAKVTLVNPVGR